VHDEIIHATVDRVGELYIETKGGQIKKFDINGKLLSVYKNRPAPTLFEPRDGSRLFAYFKNGRRIDYMNPSFEATATYKIDSAFVIEPWLVCSSGDHHIWIVDAADGTLKKIEPRKSSLLVDAKLPDGISTDFLSITTLREYQGFVFLLDKQKGIHIFNGMGKLIKTISATQLTYFNFLGEELYYPVAGKLTFLNLFSTETREISLGGSFKFVLLTDERRFMVHETTIDFFEFKP
jgi:hypothetical protein